MFVVLNKTDYHSKLQNILDGHTKFKNLNKNPIKQLKSKINNQSLLIRPNVIATKYQNKLVIMNAAIYTEL